MKGEPKTMEELNDNISIPVPNPIPERYRDVIFDEMPVNDDDKPIKQIGDLMIGHFFELQVPFKTKPKIRPSPDEIELYDLDDPEEMAIYIKQMEDEAPVYKAGTVYKVVDIDMATGTVYAASEPLYADRNEMNKSYIKEMIVLPLRRVGRANFRDRGSFYGPTKTIGDYATDDLQSRLGNFMLEYWDDPLRHKAQAQVDMIMADLERIFYVKALPAQIFELSMVVENHKVPLSLYGDIYKKFMLNTIKRLMPPEVMIQCNDLYSGYRMQPDRNNDEYDEVLVTLAVDFTLKPDYHYVGVKGFNWPI